MLTGCPVLHASLAAAPVGVAAAAAAAAVGVGGGGGAAAASVAGAAARQCQTSSTAHISCQRCTFVHLNRADATTANGTKVHDRSKKNDGTSGGKPKVKHYWTIEEARQPQ
eukprot:1159589-Pelagomonas_calceolata.AAC.11